MDDRLEFLLMGPFEVRRAGGVVDSGGGKRRALLAALLLSANRVVSVDHLRDLVWGEAAPNSVPNLIQGYVSDWRSLLSPHRSARSSGGRLLSAAGGYLLRVDPDECDLARFKQHAREGVRAAASGELVAARKALRTALAYRRGPAMSNFGDLALAAAGRRIDDAWLSALTTAAEVELRLGTAQRAVGLLEPALDEWPMREDLVALAMTALYRCGRQSDALLLYDSTRSLLAETLGVDPEPHLRELHRRVLRQDRRLDGPVSTMATVTSAPPAALSRFVGREQELADIVELGGRNRLLTLVGLGGTGKTRLAMRAAPRIAADSERLLAAVDATNLEDSSMLWSAAASALGRSLLAGPSALDAFLLQLGEQPVLLILDNMEHLRGAAAEVMRAVASAPQLALLITSRVPLGLEGEQLYMVGPLAVPDQDAADLAAVLRTPSAALFVDRARCADPTFQPTELDAAALAGICRLLDGLPLAVELAAPWVRTLSLHALLERLDRPFRLLVRHPSTADGRRHASMQAVLEWSYGALSDSERKMLRHLAMFRSGARLDALTATWHESDDALAPLSGLVTANFVQRVGEPEHPRYRMLETVRAFAASAAEPTSTRTAELAEHARFFRSLGEQAARANGGPHAARMTRRLVEEHIEIRAAIEHLQAVGDGLGALALIVDCLGLWWDGGHVTEGYRRLAGGLSGVQLKRTDGELITAAHITASYLADAAGHPAAAIEHEKHAIEQARDVGSAALEIAATATHGISLCWTDWAGDADAGIAMLAEASAAAQTARLPPQRWGWCNATSSLAFAMFGLIDVLRYRDPARARALALVIADEVKTIGEVHFAAFAQRALGMLAADIGQEDSARRNLVQSLELAEQSGSVRNIARSQHELARLSLTAEDASAAHDLACSATYASRDAGHLINWTRSAALLADCHVRLGEPARAATVLDEAERAIGSGHTNLRTWVFAPRRAQLARIAGELEAATHYLRAASPLEKAAGLDPDRRLYLLEAAQRTGDRTRRSALIDLLTGTATRLGLAIPAAETEVLRQLGWDGNPERLQTPIAL